MFHCSINYCNAWAFTTSYLSTCKINYYAEKLNNLLAISLFVEIVYF